MQKFSVRFQKSFLMSDKIKKRKEEKEEIRGSMGNMLINISC